MTDTQRETIGAVLGRVPSGLFVLTARGPEGQQTGMLASWVQQASFDPPAVTFAVKKDRYLNEWLAANADVVLNLVGETQKKFLGHFGKGFEPGEPAFEGLAIAAASSGLPALREALGWLEGTITGRVEAGDHMIYVARVTGAASGPNLAAEKPWVHVRKNGFNY
jgi:flavin reductase (DIM6/NTAB) family NADH-FMN oxidoreductase RutF